MATAKVEMEELAKRLYSEEKIRTTIGARSIGDHLKKLEFYQNRQWQPRVWQESLELRKISNMDISIF